MQENLSCWLQYSPLASLSAGVAVAARFRNEQFTSTNGQSSLTFQQPFQDRTLLNIGSLTKHIVAIAILELKRLGSLSLDDPLTTYLDAAPHSDWNDVSLLHLMSHTSGLPDCHQHFGWDQSTSSKSIIAALSRKNLNFLPGQAWAYSNSNYLVLGSVVEKIVGSTLRDFLDSQLFPSADLPHARCDSTWSVIPDRAEPYEIVRGNFVHAPRLHPSVASLGGFGALFSNDDFLAWSNALHSGDRADLHSDCLKPIILNDGMQLPYGFGWYLGIMRGEVFAWHMGAPPGFRTIHLYMPSKKIALSVSANTSIEKTILKKAVLEVLEIISPHSTYLTITPTARASNQEQHAIQMLLQSKGGQPPHGILTDAMQYTWICSPGSKPMNKIELEDCWCLEGHDFSDGIIKNYVAKAAGSLHYFSVLWTHDQKIASLTM